MEAEFDKMKTQGKNTVDGLMQWLKDANIVDGKNVTEEKAKSMFADVADAANVEIETFKGILVKLASEHKKTEEQLAKSLSEVAPMILNALAAGASAFKSALTGNK